MSVWPCVAVPEMVTEPVGLSLTLATTTSMTSVAVENAVDPPMASATLKLTETLSIVKYVLAAMLALLVNLMTVSEAATLEISRLKLWLLRAVPLPAIVVVADVPREAEETRTVMVWDAVTVVADVPHVKVSVAAPVALARLTERVRSSEAASPPVDAWPIRSWPPEI